MLLCAESWSPPPPDGGSTGTTHGGPPPAVVSCPGPNNHSIFAYADFVSGGGSTQLYETRDDVDQRDISQAGKKKDTL
jgi:hypothetical protein